MKTYHPSLHFPSSLQCFLSYFKSFLFFIFGFNFCDDAGFFHCSPGYGMMTDGTTTFVNASACTVNFLPMNPPIVFDLPNPRTTWLEEAPPQTPTANQEKGARRGRWGRWAERTEFCKYNAGVCLTGTCGTRLQMEQTKWGMGTPSRYDDSYVPSFLHLNT